jgi:NAD(P)H-flavin reductase
MFVPKIPKKTNATHNINLLALVINLVVINTKMVLFRPLSTGAAASVITKANPKFWWREGAPTKLIKRKTIIEADGPNRLPVHTLTFAIPNKEDYRASFTGRTKHHSELSIDLADIVKMVIPNYKSKSYSMSMLREHEFDLTLKVYPNGRASGYLDRMRVGDELNTFGLSGGRIRNPGAYVGIVVYGVGITEGLPVARAELEKGDAKQVVLLWASRTKDDTFWHDEIASLQKEYPKMFKMVNIFSREDREGSLHGRVNPAILKQVFQPTNAEEARFLSVGTKEMMQMTDGYFAEINYKMPKHALIPKVVARTNKIS